MFPCTYVAYLPCPFTCWCASRLPPCPAVGSVLLWTLAHVSFPVMVFSGICPVVGLLGHSSHRFLMRLVLVGPCRLPLTVHFTVPLPLYGHLNLWPAFTFQSPTSVKVQKRSVLKALATTLFLSGSPWSFYSCALCCLIVWCQFICLLIHAAANSGIYHGPSTVISTRPDKSNKNCPGHCGGFSLVEAYVNWMKLLRVENVIKYYERKDLNEWGTGCLKEWEGVS